jgi:putative ATPase
MRPTRLDEVAGQRHLLAPGSPLVSLASDDPGRAPSAVSVILWGPPGTGKTTLAQAIARQSGRRFIELSAITAGVKDVREVMERALADRDLYGTSTVLFLDEIHRFTKAQQDALLPGVENGWVILIAATTENPSFSVIAPLLSRSLLLTLEQLSDDDLRLLVERAVSDPRGLGGRVTLEADALAAIVRLASGDARRALTALEAAAQSARASGDDALPVVTAEIVAAAVDRALLRYDRQGDEHYDVISAFIKSIRGSDPDAALHYLARMIEAGEDPRFIARRVIISAAEDIGLADPQALPIAVAAAQAVQLIGMPEGRIPLAEAVVYLATAPKSNAAYIGVDAAIADVRAGRLGRVPKPLRDAHYAGAKKLGHGKGYRYPHDEPIGVVEQQHLPDPLVGTEYYRPTERGHEREISARLAKLRAIIRGTRGDD